MHAARGSSTAQARVGGMAQRAPFQWTTEIGCREASELTQLLGHGTLAIPPDICHMSLGGGGGEGGGSFARCVQIDLQMAVCVCVRVCVCVCFLLKDFTSQCGLYACFENLFPL